MGHMLRGYKKDEINGQIKIQHEEGQERNLLVLAKATSFIVMKGTLRRNKELIGRAKKTIHGLYVSPSIRPSSDIFDKLDIPIIHIKGEFLVRG